MDITSDPATLAQAWKREWITKGYREGLAEGFYDGFLEGSADALVRLLLKRFGPLDPALRTRIESADPETVQSWFDRAAKAPDLLSVFQTLGE